MRIGLLGMGTIGSGVYEIVAKRADMEITRVLDLRPIPGLGGKLTTRFEDILEDKSIDTVVELMGGLEPAHEFVVRALRAGKSVVTANKLMLSHHYAEVAQAAHDSGAGVRISASVGGGIPYLHNLLRARRVDNILWVGGILHGTTNLLLDTLQSSGAGFDEVLREAQRLGYAEADPSSDIDGIDVRSKITIAMNIAFGGVADTRAVPTEGIRRLTGEDVRQFARMGRVCRFLARARRADGGRGGVRLRGAGAAGKWRDRGRRLQKRQYRLLRGRIRGRAALLRTGRGQVPHRLRRGGGPARPAFAPGQVAPARRGTGPEAGRPPRDEALLPAHERAGGDRGRGAGAGRRGHGLYHRPPERGGYARAGGAAARHRRDDLLRRPALNAEWRRAYTEWDVMFA